jgi:hypothetical protein
MNATTQMKQHGAGAPVHIETNGFILRSLTAADATPRFVSEARLFQECISIEGKRVDTLLFCTFKDQTLLAKAGRSLK